LESSAVGREPNSDEGLKYSDVLSAVKARTVRNRSKVIFREWKRLRSGYNVKEVREEVNGLLALRDHPLF
jgi:hypothetical protein